MSRDKESVYNDLLANLDKTRAVHHSEKSGQDWHADNLSVHSEKLRLLHEYQAADPTADIRAAVADAEQQRSWSRRKLGLEDQRPTVATTNAGFCDLGGVSVAENLGA